MDYGDLMWKKKTLDGFTGLPPGNFIIAIESPMYL